MKINAQDKEFAELNERVKKALAGGAKAVEIEKVNGQRYLGCGLRGGARLTIEGVPGNDLGAFMDGLDIEVKGNAQDAVGNTMNSGRIIIHGSAGDVAGYSMRSGKIYIKGDAGYRIGIHMKSYKKELPVIIVGGTAGDFFGEYMAGGIMILLGLDESKKPVVGDFIGTGMHGGVIYIRGKVENHKLGREVKATKAGEKDMEGIMPYLSEFCREFGLRRENILSKEFTKLVPYSHRPYGRVYSY